MRVEGQRLISLDAFRGLTIALMIVVNNAGSDAIHHQLRHAPWNGWTAADTVFPSFLWIVGVAMVFSLSKRISQGIPRTQLIPQILRRALLLFVLGIIIYIAPGFNLSTQRFMGVLQRIAICYAFASLIYLFTNLRGVMIWIVALLTSYWILMTSVPVPGYGPGNLTIEGNFAHYIDRIVLGAHNYRWTKTWDPEGIVGTIPAIATTLLGVVAGYLLRGPRDLRKRIMWLIAIGAGLMIAGEAANYWLPINKHLWTSSFTLFMGGLDFILFAVFVWLIDVRGHHRVVRPLVIIGTNPIAVYMASELLAELIGQWQLGSGDDAVSIQEWIFQSLFLRVAPEPIAALLYAIAFLLLMYALAWELHRRRWFLRV